jgi:hypothetical protein
MRTLFLALFLLIAIPALAADIQLAWDPMPVGETWKTVRAYELKSGAGGANIYTQVGEVAASVSTLTLANISPGEHRYVVRAYDGTWESGDSNVAGTPPLPASPSGLKVTITLTFSANQ